MAEDSPIIYNFNVPSRFLYSQESVNPNLCKVEELKHSSEHVRIMELNETPQIQDSILRKIVVEQGNPNRGGPGLTNESFRVLYKLYLVPKTGADFDYENLEILQENSLDDPLEFIPSDEGLIPGLEKLVPSMLEGETSELFATHHFAFGSQDYNKLRSLKIVPGKSNIILRVKLLKILGHNVLSKKQGRMMKRVIRKSSEYGGPIFDSVCTANIKCYAYPESNDESCEVRHLENIRLGFDDSIGHGLYKALKTMCKSEIAHFELSEDFSIDERVELRKSGDGKVSKLCYEVELIDFTTEFNRFHLYPTKFGYPLQLIEKLVECIKENTSSSLLAASHGLKLLKVELRNTNQIDSDAEFISEDSSNAADDCLPNTSENQTNSSTVVDSKNKEASPYNDEDLKKIEEEMSDMNVGMEKLGKPEKLSVEAEAEIEELVNKGMEQAEEEEQMLEETVKKLKFRVDSNYSLVLMRRKKFLRALSVLDDALEFDQSNPKLISRQIQCFLEVNNYEQAKSLSIGLLESDPDNRFAKSSLEYATKQLNAADHALRRAFSNIWN